MQLWQLFLAFFRANMLGYGGGPSIVPLYEAEVVDRYGWMTREEFGQALALGNALPGPIATKLGAYVGYKVAGWAGALVALAATTLPTAVMLIALGAALTRFKDHPFVRGMIRGVQPVVFVMLAMMAADFVPHAFGRGAVSFALAAGFFLAVNYLGIHPSWGVLAAMVLGGLFLR